MEPGEPRRCPACGATFDSAQQRCRSCGATRKAADADQRTQLLVRFLTALFAVAAILMLVGEAQIAAYLLAPGGHAQLLSLLTQMGLTYGDPADAIRELTFAPAVGCALHVGAYFGLRARRPWGWGLAVAASLLWCIFLVGLPVLFLLVRRRTRAAFGV